MDIKRIGSKASHWQRLAVRIAHLLSGLTLAATVASCGGGGDSSESGPPIADLPPAVTLAGPTQAETGASTTWQSSLGAVQPGWSVEWNFGDGAVSAQAQPSHVYARAGDYTVRYTVRRGNTDSRSAIASVQIRAYAMSVDRNCSGAGASGWCWQQPLPFARDLTDAVLVDRQTAYAVGPGNTMVATRNGGVDWPLQNVPAAPPPAFPATVGAGQALQFVRFVDASVGVASASYPGRVLRTMDGGNSWTATTAIEMYWIKGLWLLDRQTIVVSGFRQYDRFGYGLRFGNLTLISSDGGQTWREAALVVSAVTADRVLWGVPWAGLIISTSFMVSRDLGLTASEVGPCCLASELSRARPDRTGDTDQLALSKAPQETPGAVSQQRVHRSTDAGRSWTTMAVQAPSGEIAQRLIGIGYRSATEAWGTFALPVTDLQGASQFQWQRARSNDGGSTWSSVGAPIETAPSAGRLLRLDANAWALARHSLDVLWFEDGSETLHTLRLPESAAMLQRLERRDGALLAGFGGPQRWYLSTNMGATWRASPGADSNSTQSTISGLWFFDTQRGLASSSDGGFLATDNGGRTWTAQLSGPDRTWANLHFTSDGTGWALAADGLRRSTDRGLTWATITLPGATPRVLHAVDARQAWVLVSLCTDAGNPASCSAQWQVTRDGGVNWVRVPVPDGVVRVHFTSASDGIAFAGSRVHATSDGGQTWTESAFVAPNLVLMQIRFVDTRRGWMLFSGVVGPRGGNASGLLITRDGGRTWSASAGPLPGGLVLEDMAFADPMNGWIVGGNGTILATRDGGENWEVQGSGTPRGLRVVAAFDAFTAWVGGERGSLLATGTGGR